MASLAIISSAPAQATDEPADVPFTRDPTRDIDSLNDVSSYDLYADEDTMYVMHFRWGRGGEYLRAYSLETGERIEAKDFDAGPYRWFTSGLWSDGEVFWVLDLFATDIEAYGAQDPNEEDSNYGKYLYGVEYDRFDMPGLEFEGDYALGLWSDGEVVYTASHSKGEILAYDFDTGDRLPEANFTTLTNAGNSAPTGVWSDGSTMWVSDEDDAKLYAYDLASHKRQEDLDFNTLSAAGNQDPAGLWSDGETMWVADSEDRKIYAYHMPTAPKIDTLEVSDVNNLLRTTGESFSGRVASGVTSVTVTAGAVDSDDVVSFDSTDADADVPGHQWTLVTGENSLTVTLTDDETQTKTYTLNVERTNLADVGDNAALDTLSVNGTELDLQLLPGGVWTASTNVARTVESLTVLAVAEDVSAGADDPSATISITPRDTDTDTSGHQVPVFEILTKVQIRVVAADGETERIYRLEVTSDPAEAERTSENDIPVENNRIVTSLYAHENTLWTGWHRISQTGRGILAYDLDSGDRIEAKTIAATQNTAVDGLWGNGTTLWALDNEASKVEAYSLSDDDYGERLAAKSFIHKTIGKHHARGAWSDGTTLWITTNIFDRLWAFDLDKRARASGKDFDHLARVGNGNPSGLWSDGETMWVTDMTDVRVYAYDMDSKRRLPALEIDNLRENGIRWPGALWSDGETLWIADQAPFRFINNEWTEAGDRTVYAYALPSRDATLESISVDGTVIDPFDRDTFEYDVDAGTADSVTVAATPTHEDASVTIMPDDADLTTDGHQVSLSSGDVTTVTFEVQLSGASNITYTVDISAQVQSSPQTVAASPAEFERDEDADIVLADENRRPTGLWSDFTTLWVADADDAKIYAYSLADGSRDADQDIDTLADANSAPWGIWSDGSTLWVADTSDDKVYAYSLADGTRDADQDIDTLADAHHSPVAMWSDGRRLWIVNMWLPSTTFAYNLADGTRSAQDDVAHTGITSANGVWSDGTTVWVTNYFSRELNAFDLATGIAKPDFDINLLENAGNHAPLNIWSDGRTMWVADRDDHRIYAYSTVNDDASDDATDDLDEAGLTAQLSGTPQTHDGTEFTLQVRFDEPITTSYVNMRDDIITATRAEVTQARRVDGNSDLWGITIVPDSGADVEISVSASAQCGQSLAVCTAANDPLLNSISVTVPGPALTASFSREPESHSGTGSFTIRVHFSEPISTSFVNMRDDVFSITGGRIARARRLNGRSDAWELTIRPHASSDTVISLAAGAACGTPQAVCSSYGKQLSSNPSTTIEHNG